MKKKYRNKKGLREYNKCPVDNFVVLKIEMSF